MKTRNFILSAVALTWPLAAHAGFEFAPASSSAQRQQQAPAVSGILTPEPSSMPIIPAIPVTAEPLAPPQTDRVLSNPVRRNGEQVQINPAPLQRRIHAPANQPFDGEALLDATILGAPIELAPDNIQVASAPARKREIDINLYPLQDSSQPALHNSIETLAGIDRGMMEENGSLRPVAVPGGRVAPEQQGFVIMQEPEEFVPPMPVRKPEVPVAAMSEPASQESFTDAVGFGRDLPLALALSQVVPAEYSYSFGLNVDAGTTVSWQGGKPWNEVLQDMLSQSGLRADLRGKQVMVKTAGL